MGSSATGSSSWTTRTGSACGRVALENPQFTLLLRNYAACRGACGATNPRWLRFERSYLMPPTAVLSEALAGGGARLVQMTPPYLQCSIHFGKGVPGITAKESGSLQRVYLAVK